MLCMCECVNAHRALDTVDRSLSMLWPWLMHVAKKRSAAPKASVSSSPWLAANSSTMDAPEHVCVCVRACMCGISLCLRVK